MASKRRRRDERPAVSEVQGTQATRRSRLDAKIAGNESGTGGAALHNQTVSEGEAEAVTERRRERLLTRERGSTMETREASVGYVTESQSERTIHSLNNLVQPSAVVVRDRALQGIPAEQVVPGDILVLKPGSHVAADGRLLEARRLTVDESALTGESLPVTKVATVLTDPDLPLADRVNMVYRGTLVTGGQGLVVVTATGAETEIGHIQQLASTAETPQTPMERQLDDLGRRLVFISGGVCGLVFGVGLLQGYGFLEMLTTTISLAVAAVPEGLPTIATTALALGLADMRKQKRRYLARLASRR